MDLQLKEKVIIVTGGSKGIGYGICEQLVKEEAIVVIVGRNKDSIPKAVNKLTERGGKVGFVYAELTNPEECQWAVKEVVNKYGTIDGLVNNAGVNDGVSLAEGDFETFTRSIHRNLTHYFLMAHYCLPALKKSRGAIVNIGSKTSVTGQGGTSGYAASNGGRNALTREWAVELLPFSIRVNAVIVAESFTPLYKKWIESFPNPEQKRKEIEAKIPLEKRMTTPKEIGSAVAFLLSGQSSHTTGQLFFVDGGYTHLDRSL
jgi:L-fucose dehydrogenase